MSRYAKASIGWYFLMFLFTTFLLPLLGWSDNEVSWSQIVINFMLWSVICAITIYIDYRKNKKQHAKNETVG